MKELKILSCGTPVRTKLGLIDGIITATCIRFNSIAYEISYFYDGEGRTLWMNEAEFTTNTKHSVIGFK